MCSARHVPLRLLATALSLAVAGADSPEDPELHQPEAQPEAPLDHEAVRRRGLLSVWVHMT